MSTPGVVLDLPFNLQLPEPEATLSCGRFVEVPGNVDCVLDICEIIALLAVDEGGERVETRMAAGLVRIGKLLE